MTNREKLSFTHSDGFYKGSFITFEHDITDGPFANGSTDRVTIYDPVTHSERKYLVRESGYVLSGQTFEVGTIAEQVFQLHAYAHKRHMSLLHKA
jgi:hypothetical protein